MEEPNDMIRALHPEDSPSQEGADDHDQDIEWLRELVSSVSNVILGEFRSEGYSGRFTSLNLYASQTERLPGESPSCRAKSHRQFDGPQERTDLYKGLPCESKESLRGNRALMFNEQWAGKATSLCGLRWCNGNWEEVLKSKKVVKERGVDVHTWTRLQAMIGAKELASRAPGSLVIRAGDWLYVAAYEQPYACVQQHSVYAKASILQSLIALELSS